MMRFSRLGPVLSAVVIAWILSGCVAPIPPVPAPLPKPADNGCPVTPYSHLFDSEDHYVDIPESAIGETIDTIILPDGRPVGCENPKYRLVKGGKDKDGKDKAYNLFLRLTKDARPGTLLPSPLPEWPTGTYTVYNFVTQLKIRPDGIAVGYRGPKECRGSIIWIFQWPGEVTRKFKPVELEFVDELATGQCKTSRDADGGGP